MSSVGSESFPLMTQTSDKFFKRELFSDKPDSTFNLIHDYLMEDKPVCVPKKTLRKTQSNKTKPIRKLK